MAALSVTGDHEVGPVTKKHGGHVGTTPSTPQVFHKTAKAIDAEYSVNVAAGKKSNLYRLTSQNRTYTSRLRTYYELHHINNNILQVATLCHQVQ
jgi:hypothetical protein